MSIRRYLMAAGLMLAAISSSLAGNKPEREAWFHQLGFGMFIHWSVDSQLGAVISHSLAGASGDYVERYFNELPKTFNPVRFAPQEWAVLAKISGMKYVVFTAKHHSGFCMWDTATTDFNIMNTPFKRDITCELFDALREQGLAVGVYYSPDDFLYCYKHGYPIGRAQHPMHYPANDSDYLAYDKAQMKELLTGYGKIDMLFIDGPYDGLKEYAWELDPDIVVTRGELETPEQKIKATSSSRPWESCFTMGTDWQYKPTNDPHKSGTDIINMLVETRAKGGNLLLNIGPKPNGEIQIEQETRLREVALWNWCNAECIGDVYPWPEIRQDEDIWFLSSKDAKTVYAVVPAWKYGTRKEFVFRSVKGGPKTKVSILGYASELVEYKKGFDASIRWTPTPSGLMVSGVNGHRLYTNNKWPNPVVFKIENIEYRDTAVVGKEKGKKEKAFEGAL